MLGFPIPSGWEGSQEDWEAYLEHIWQVYLDNFDEGRSVPFSHAQDLIGTASAWQKQMQRVYELWGLPRNPKKSSMQEMDATSLGAQILGDIGIIRPKPQKMLESTALALTLCGLRFSC